VEEIYVHAEKDQNVMVNNNETHTVVVDRTHAVGEDGTITVGRNRLHFERDNLHDEVLRTQGQLHTRTRYDRSSIKHPDRPDFNEGYGDKS